MKDSNSKNILTTVKEFFEKFTKGYKTGLGYGGPCLPRDNIALASLNKKLGYDLSLPNSVDEINNSIPKNLYNEFLKRYKNKKILFLGISYKPKTSYYEKSQSLEIVKKTAKKNNVSVFDYNPIIINLESKILIETNIEKAIKKNEIIVLCHYDNRYNKLNLKNKIVIDFWKQLKTKPKKYLSF
jgi:Predicted UDP-glucose 6-dehydrogenase